MITPTTLPYTGNKNCSYLINTRKWAKHCHNEINVKKKKEKIIKYPLLVTGIGGAGTNLAASSLRRLGVTIGHEYIDGSGSVSWIHAVNDAVVGQQYPFPRKGPHITTKILPEHSPVFEKVIHLVRCPVGNMAGLTTHTNWTRDFIWRAAGIHPNTDSTNQPPCLWAAKAWFFWNSHVETYADNRLRVEDFTNPEDMARILCKEGSLSCFSSRRAHLQELLAPNYRVHHREHGTCSMKEIFELDPKLATEMVRMARRYGYGSSKLCNLNFN
eukprot:CAMPEP_0114351244 /NCGR_PEP_ID=MMETSP0101-20121206/17027_1 /TAXON_ID=38822 ORGANISM="Pteridomonas danica, Strain PT" /NCGR_SAMPLE_ID=MMETSP0101 /ASSEMBLY_ACC=CAM_ASM_000211 /LENGTH=270 /DNA_ID=CAMNT_0001491001 /DNA_START=293 /DNA_END=1105 /DNA_ORIENTATION=+